VEIDMNFEQIHYETVAVGPKSGDGVNLLGLVMALGAGIAFGLVLAVCFLEGQNESAASVKSLFSEISLTKQNAWLEGESVWTLHAIVPDKRFGSATRQLSSCCGQITKY
jgi:hypothetical protein